MDKKIWYVLGGIAAVILILVLWFVGSYNSLVRLDTTVEEKWAQVENQYQRRADLVPNLVATVKGYAAHEENLFTEVTKLRSQWGAAAASGDREGQIQAARGMDSAISRLLLVAENYPQLRASENFLALQSQLEGTENRIAVERMRYNEIVREYNIKIRRIPTVFIANMFGFDAKEFFEADEGSQQVPEVSF
ncbi:MAG: LemA family protein [Candidatus Altiarchaeota archaeon]